MVVRAGSAAQLLRAHRRRGSPTSTCRPIPTTTRSSIRCWRSPSGRPRPSTSGLRGIILCGSTYPLPWQLGDFSHGIGYYADNNSPLRPATADFLLVIAPRVAETEKRLDAEYFQGGRPPAPGPGRADAVFPRRRSSRRCSRDANAGVPSVGTPAAGPASSRRRPTRRPSTPPIPSETPPAASRSEPVIDPSHRGRHEPAARRLGEAIARLEDSDHSVASRSGDEPRRRRRLREEPAANPLRYSRKGLLRRRHTRSAHRALAGQHGSAGRNDAADQPRRREPPPPSSPGRGRQIRPLGAKARAADRIRRLEERLVSLGGVEHEVFLDDASGPLAQDDDAR